MPSPLRRRALALIVTLLAVPLALAVNGPTASGQVASDRLPTVGPGLVQAAAALPAGGTVEVIVSAWSADGLAQLDALGVASRRLRTQPMAFARLTASQLTRLSTSPAIRSLWPRQRYDLSLTESTQMVGADRAERVLGVAGKGVAVAVVDTGIDATHPDLPWHTKVKANYEVVTNPFDPAAPLLVDTADTDDDGHGTHVASTVAGNDADGGHVNDGVAPGADLYGYSVNVSLTIDNARSLAAFDDIIAKRQAGIPIVAISNSWGGAAGEHSPDDPLSILTKAAYDAGVSVIFAAGNSGQETAELDTASSQCTMPWVVCVGAETKPGQLVAFSSRGRPPVATHVVQPDGLEYDVPPGNHDRALGQRLGIGVFRPTVTGPGVNIVAACAKSACGPTGDYQSLSGTSMSTPHVSGVVALINGGRLAASGKVDLTAGRVIDLLEGTANPMPGWQAWEAGAGEVDAYEAVRLAQSGAAVPRPNLGAVPAPVGAPTTASEDGVTTADSYETKVGFGEHTVQVPPGTARLDLTTVWDLPAENLYLYAWGPGADPDGDDATRADQEAWGLLEGVGPRLGTYREAVVPYPEPGEWTVRVYGRANGVTPYTLTSAVSPAARAGVSVTGAAKDGSLVRLTGSSRYTSVAKAGVTRSVVPNTALPFTEVGDPVPFWLHGAAGTGDRGGDFLLGAGAPFFDQEEPATPVPQMQTGGAYGNNDFAGNFLLAYWRGAFEGTLQGDVPITMWVSSQTQPVIGGQLVLSLFDVPAGTVGDEDARLVGRATVPATGIGPAPTKVDAVLPQIAYTVAPERELILQVGGVFIDQDHFQVWYDSTEFPSGFTLPVLEGSRPGRPAGLAATSLLGKGARISWDRSADATSYTVYRSTSPTSLGTALGTVTPKGGSRVSFTDAGLAPTTTGYYRVVGIRAGAAGEPSDLVTATPVATRRWTEVRAGAGPWETIATSTSWTAKVRRAAGPGSDPTAFTVRSHTFDGASVLVGRQVAA